MLKALLLLVVLQVSISAQARTCADVFRPVDSEAEVSIAHLELQYLRLQNEQESARSREWTSDQLREIQKKGQIDFAEATLVVKYYRGLIVWKMKLLAQEIRKLKESETFETYKLNWPSQIKVVAQNLAHQEPIFAYAPDFHRVRTIAETILRVQDETPEQIAGLLYVGRHLRSQKRYERDPEGAEAEVRELLTPLFPEITLEQVREVVTTSLKARPEKINCCGRGFCDGCTHPNVVFRDKEAEPGPTYRGITPNSTLPLFQIMDDLKLAYPEREWGYHFWENR
jgi:hypothetical protein